jgi:hypothetical protein
MGRTAALGLVVLLLASHASPQAPTSPLELTKQYLAAAKARDAAKVASFYADDAVLMPPNAPPIHGRKAIQQDHEQLFKESPPFELTATPLASETSGVNAEGLSPEITDLRCPFFSDVLVH